MKTKSPILLIVLLHCLFFMFACKKNDDSKPSQTYDHCLQINDAINGNPIANVGVTLTVVNATGSNQDHPGLSDQSGKCCIQIPNSSTIVGYALVKTYYTTVIGTGVPTSVQMTPEARLTLYIKNDQPSDVNDVMTLSYEHPIAGDSVIKIFYGANVDTLMHMDVRPGMNTIKWNSVHMGVSSDSSFGPINMYANQTTYTIIY